MTTTDTEKTLAKIERLRDEAKVKLHLASLDAKKEWDDKIAPRLVRIEGGARDKIDEIVRELEEFVSRLERRAS